jgi:hypothetical protein
MTDCTDLSLVIGSAWRWTISTPHAHDGRSSSPGKLTGTFSATSPPWPCCAQCRPSVTSSRENHSGFWASGSLWTNASTDFGTDLSTGSDPSSWASPARRCQSMGAPPVRARHSTKERPPTPRQSRSISEQARRVSPQQVERLMGVPPLLGHHDPDRLVDDGPRGQCLLQLARTRVRPR